ncbi:MAG: NADP-dependent oxidoreductase [Waddliaceae bacterium]
MKAITIKKFCPVEEMHLTDLPTPQPTANEVQIQIAYTAVNPVDWKICEGWLKKMIPHEFPLIPGWDAAGTVTAMGKNVMDLKIGDEVYAYCRKPTVQWGTYAEYVCFNANHVALKPKKFNFAQAASIPLVGLTAWQSLFEAANLQKGESILIHAGAGGVGSLAIEFAKYAGAKIYTTASGNNHGYVKKLGADYAIDYHKEDFVEKIHSLDPEGVDVVMDCVGYDALTQSFDVIKPGGRLISIVQKIDKEKCEERNIHGEFVFVRPDGEQLKEIADLIDKGVVIAPHIEEMPLADFGKALAKNREGHTQGKIVLRVIQ